MVGTPTYYIPSGRVGANGWIHLVFALCVSAFIGAIYGLVVRYNPFVVVNMLGTVLLGALAGGLVGFAAKSGHIRNARIILGFTLVTAGVAIYSAWVAWIFAVTGFKVFSLDPRTLWQVIDWVNRRGAWEMIGGRPTGGALYAIWLAEAGLIVYCAWLGQPTAFRVPYCEQCGCWANKRRRYKPLSFFQDSQQAIAQIEHGHYDSLFELTTVTYEEDAFSKVSLNHCPQCKTFCLLTLKTVIYSTKTKKTLVRNLVLPPEDFATLREHFDGSIDDERSVDVEDLAPAEDDALAEITEEDNRKANARLAPSPQSLSGLPRRSTISRPIKMLIWLTCLGVGTLFVTLAASVKLPDRTIPLAIGCPVLLIGICGVTFHFLGRPGN